MKLIDNWKSAWRFSSMQLQLVATLADIAMACLVVVNTSFPFNPLWYVVLRLALTLTSMGARLIAQQSK